MIFRGLTDTNILVEKGRSIQRLSVNVRMSTATAVGLAMPDLTKVQMKCILRRNSKEYVIFNDTLAVLALESMFFNGIEQLMSPGYMSIVTTGAVSIYAQNIIIDLKTPINLQGRDELTLEVSVTPSWLTFAGAIAQANACTIEMVWRDAIGIETFIPMIRSKYIQAGITKVDESIGDDITSLAFINTSGLTYGYYITDANAIIQQLTLTTDRYSINDTVDRMVGRRAAQFEQYGVSNNRGFNFVIIPDGECDQVKLSMLLNSANVLVSQNALVWRTYAIDGHTINRAANMAEKHDRRNTAKLRGQLNEQ